MFVNTITAIIQSLNMPFHYMYHYLLDTIYYLFIYYVFHVYLLEISFNGGILKEIARKQYLLYSTNTGIDK